MRIFNVHRMTAIVMKIAMIVSSIYLYELVDIVPLLFSLVH